VDARGPRGRHGDRGQLRPRTTMKRWASCAAWAAGRSRCTARAPPRSLTPGTTHGRGTRSTRGRGRCPR
jgi:hypothetical protein